MSDIYDNWLNILLQITTPIINGFVNKNIKNIFPTHFPKSNPNPNKENVFIELFCRTILGISFLFQNIDFIKENNLETFFYNTLIAIENAFSGYLEFNKIGNQLMVEMALLLYAFTKTPFLWNSLNDNVKKIIFNISSYSISQYKPHPNNWLLFEAIIEIFLYKNYNKKLNKTLINLQNIERLYIGDSWYKDGSIFHMDFYNSYIILPFLLTIYNELYLLFNKSQTYKVLYNKTLEKIQRHSEFLERLIGENGSFPIFGRSAIYRTAIFHALLQTAYIKELPQTLSYGQVREGINAVINNIFNNNNIQIFDEHGFLTYGFSGFQPEMADGYSNSGSTYFALLIFMPLGLNKNHIFWNDDYKEWSQKKLYNGKSINCDKAIN